MFKLTRNGSRNTLLTDGGKLILGGDFTIDDNDELKISGAVGVQTDDELSTTSDNPLKNRVLTNFLNSKKLLEPEEFDELNTKIDNIETTPGKSAYELYVDSVPEGEEVMSEQEWMESLKGAAFTFNDFTPEQLESLKGYKGDQGEQGPQGPQGPQGEQGQPGENSYFHVAYCNIVNGNIVNFSLNDPTDREYIGTYVDNNPSASLDASLYTWMKVKGAQGEDGQQGIPGVNGQDGKTSYLHIKYSNDAGQSFTDNDGETPGYYMGQYVDFNEADSSEPSDYKWVLIKGEDGNDGTGINIKGAVNTYEELLEIDTTQLNAGDAYMVDKYLYIWTGETWRNVGQIKGEDGRDGTDGINGRDGIDGTNGVSAYVHIAWANSADGVVDFTTSPVAGINYTYMGIYADSISEDSQVASNYIWTLIKGKDGVDGRDGQDGLNGQNGVDGADGTSSYFHIAYANKNEQGEIINFDLSNPTDREYIGTYVDENKVDSGDPSKYNWQLVKGAQGETGEQGIPGTNGIDGKTQYLHIKYSDDGGNTFTPAQGALGPGETPGAYLGQYVDFEQTDSSTPSRYKWVLIKGIDGTDGKDGTSITILGAYDTQEELEAAVDTTDLQAGSSYIVGSDLVIWTGTEWKNVGQIKGADGKDGERGEAGQSSYLHIAWANAVGDTVDEFVQFTTTKADRNQNFNYMGIYTDNIVEDSQNPLDYVWTLIKGETGTFDASVLVNYALIEDLENYQAIANLKTQVESNTGNIQTNATSIGTLRSNLAEATTEFNTKFEEVNGDIETNSEAISGLTSRLGTAEATLGTKASQTDVDELSGTVQTNSSSILSLQSGLQSANASIETKASKEDLNGKVDNTTFLDFKTTQEEAVANLGTKVDSVSDTVTTHTESITNLQSGLQSANASIATKASQSSVNELSQKVDTNTESIVGLTSDLESATATIATKADKSTLDNYVTSEAFGEFTSTYDEAQTTLGTRLEGIEGDIQTNTSSIGTLRSDLNSANATIATKASQSDLNTLNGKVTTNSESILSLTSDLDDAKAAIETKASQTSVNDLGDTVSSHTTSIATLNSNLESANAAISTKANKTDLDDYVTTESFGTFQSDYDSAQTTLGTRLNTIEGNISTNSSSIATLQSDLDSAEATISTNYNTLSGQISNKLNTSDFWTTLGYTDKEAFEQAIDEAGGLTPEQLALLESLTPDDYLTTNSLLSLVSDENFASTDLGSAVLAVTKDNVSDNKILSITNSASNLQTIADSVSASSALTNKFATITALNDETTARTNAISTLTNTVNNKIGSAELSTALSDYYTKSDIDDGFYDKDTVDGKIATAKTEARSGLLLTSELGQAIADLNTYYTKTDADAATTTAIGNFRTEANNTYAKTSQIANFVTSDDVSGMISTATAGLVAQADYNSAQSAMSARVDGVESSITNAVMRDPTTGKVTSTVTFGADNAELNADGSGYLANGNVSWDNNGNITLAGTMNSGSVGGWIIDDTTISRELVTTKDQYERPIDTSNITLDSEIPKITVSNINNQYMSESSYQLQKQITSNINIIANNENDFCGISLSKRTKVFHGNSSGHSIVLSPDAIQMKSSSFEMGYSGQGYSKGIPISLNADGSGWLANNNFSWDSEGNIRLGDDLNDENLHEYQGISLTKDLFKIGYQGDYKYQGLDYDANRNSLDITDHNGHYSSGNESCFAPEGVATTSVGAFAISRASASREMLQTVNTINILTAEDIPGHIAFLVNNSGLCVNNSGIEVSKITSSKIISPSFVNSNSSDSEVLLGGGGTKALSDFVQLSQSGTLSINGLNVGSNSLSSSGLYLSGNNGAYVGGTVETSSIYGHDGTSGLTLSPEVNTGNRIKLDSNGIHFIDSNGASYLLDLTTAVNAGFVIAETV